MPDRQGDALHDLARQALAVLRARGVAAGNGAIIALTEADDGPPLEICHRGPDLPDAVPEPVADYGLVAAQPPDWQGRHRLVVRAPLVVFDLCWNPDEPLRVLGFSRGDWEKILMGEKA